MLSEILLDRDLQSHNHDGTRHSNMEHLSAMEGNSSLNPDLFVNPVVPDVVNSFPESTAKAMNAVKPTHQKSNKLLEKNNTRVSKGQPARNGKGNPKEQRPVNAPSVLESKYSKKGINERRASTLKREYPGIAGVGNSITKKRRQQVLTQHKAKFPGITAKVSTNGKKSKLAQALAHSALSTEQQKLSGSPPLPEIREEWLANISKDSGGASTENPITID